MKFTDQITNQINAKEANEIFQKAEKARRKEIEENRLKDVQEKLPKVLEYIYKIIRDTAETRTSLLIHGSDLPSDFKFYNIIPEVKKALSEQGFAVEYNAVVDKLNIYWTYS